MEIASHSFTNFEEIAGEMELTHVELQKFLIEEIIPLVPKSWKKVKMEFVEEIEDEMDYALYEFEVRGKKRVVVGQPDDEEVEFEGLFKGYAKHLGIIQWVDCGGLPIGLWVTKAKS
jgi:hypothetical protein